MDRTRRNAPVVDLTPLLREMTQRGPEPHALGIAGLLGALEAAEDLLHTDPNELALRDELTASVVREYLREHVPPQADLEAC
jgi:hypothetical protein